MRQLRAAGLLVRRIRIEAGMILLLFLLVAGTSFVFAAGPRFFNRLADNALRYAVRTALPAERDVVLGLASNIAPGDGGGISGVRDTGHDLEKRFPPSLAALISRSVLRVTPFRFSVPNPPSLPTFVSLRYQDGLTDATRLVSGRWPVDRGVPLPPATIGFEPVRPGSVKPVLFEVALSTEEANQIGVHVGDHLALALDATDLLLPRVPYQIVPTEIQVVGLYEPIDSKSDYWAGDTSLIQASITGIPDIDIPTAYATAYIPAETYPDLWSAGLPFRYEWRFTVDPERLDAGRLAELQDDLRHIDFVIGASEFATPGIAVMRTGLPGILDRYAAERALSEAVLSFATIGPFALAAGAFGMVAVLLIVRRRGSLALARGRGASGWLVLVTQLWESIVLTGSAALLGLLAAVTLVPARDSPTSVALALAVGGAATLLLLGASWRSAQGPLGQLGRDDPPVLRVAPRRLVIEMTIVGIAAGGALLLRQRGLTAGGTEGGVPRLDPLLAAVPVLSGLAAGIVAMRLYPLPIRGLGWLAARRRDLVPVLGLRTIGRHPAAANLPLLVLMLTAAFAAFSSVIVSSLDQGQVVASYEEVGADYRIEQGPLVSLVGLDPAAVPGVEAVAAGFVDTSAPFASVEQQRARVYFDAVEPGGYEKVTSGTPIDPHWPGAFLAQPPAAGAGTAAHPIPAILSQRLPPGSASLAPGDRFRITVSGQEMTFQVAQRRDGFPGIGDPESFAVVPYDWARSAFKGSPVYPSVIWLRAPQDVAGRLAAVARQSAGAYVMSRHDVLDSLRDAPLTAAIGIGYLAAIVVAAIYLALSIAGALVLSSARRTQDLAYLRTLGLTASQALGITVMENAPPVVLALAPGIALGIGVAFLLEPGLGLATFVGAGDVPLFVDWRALGLMVVALIGVVVLAVTAGTWLSRQARLVDALRMAED